MPRLDRGDRAQVTFDLPTERRGLIDAGAYEAAIADPLGLARRRARRPAGRPAVSCCPASSRSRPWCQRGSAGSGPRAPGRLRSGSSRAARCFGATQQGDDLRRVHWRTTARVGELMVREGGDQRRSGPDRDDGAARRRRGDDAARRARAGGRGGCERADRGRRRIDGGVSGAYRIADDGGSGHAALSAATRTFGAC